MTDYIQDVHGLRLCNTQSCNTVVESCEDDKDELCERDIYEIHMHIYIGSNIMGWACHSF